VCLTWKPDTDPAAIDAVIEGLAGLPAVIPELTDYHFGPDLGLVPDGNAHFVIVGHFADAEAWTRYQQHPEHQRVIVELMRPILASRTSAQFASGGPDH
jgi:Stress responsive A/B Barrel Domain